MDSKLSYISAPSVAQRHGGPRIPLGTSLRLSSRGVAPHAVLEIVLPRRALEILRRRQYFIVIIQMDRYCSYLGARF